MNWEYVDDLLDELERESASNRLAEYDWPRIWRLINQIEEVLKGVRYPSLAAKQEARERFQTARDNASQIAEREREARRYASEKLRDQILKEVESSRPNDLFGFSPPDREEMKAYGQRLKAAGQELSEHKAEMLAEHKKECFERIQEMRKIHDAWWDDLRSHHERKRTEWLSNQEGRRNRILENLRKNRERYAKTANAIERTRAFADDLRNKIQNAWNEDWASQAEERLADAERRIEDMETSLARIESWIEEDERRLG